MNIFLRLFSDLLITIFTVVCWNKCNNNKFHEKLRQNIILIILQTIIIASIATFVPNPFKLIITLLYLITINYFTITKDIIKSLIQTIISQLFICISEITFVMVATLTTKGEIQKTMQETQPFILLTLFVFLLSMTLLKLKIPQKLYKFIIKCTNTIKNEEILAYSIMVLTVMIISTVETFMKLPTSIILLTNILMAIIMISIIVKFVITKSKFNSISNKYQTSITSIKELEELIDKTRISNHENKNELLTIRNMIKEKDKKTAKYIDNLINNKTKDNNNIMKATYKIPEGGLRAIIYSKLCTMDKLKIKYKLYVSKEVKTEELIELSDELILNICKILGVFFDNSIDAVRDINDKMIIIEMYIIDGELYIGITNNYKGNLDIGKMNKNRYTTKGQGHGYGLSLVSKIIEENSEILSNEKEINGNKFTQILKIKM